jgi:predicted GIY-YIG superfamily endonuclease
MPYAIYIVQCSDGSYYTGRTKDLEARLHEHESGAHSDSYTFGRRPIKLAWSIVTESYQEAFPWEPQLKGWSRAKKEALIRGDIEGIHQIVTSERRRRRKKPLALRATSRKASEDEA